MPEFLAEPLPDPWTNAPMKYRRTESGSYLLYAIGNDREDNGGGLDRQKPDSEQRDAIWLYARP